MQAMITWGMECLAGLRVIGEWFTAPVGSLASLMGGFADYFINIASQFGLGDVMEFILYHTALPFELTVGSLMVGTGMTAVLGYKFVKFITDIVL